MLSLFVCCVKEEKNASGNPLLRESSCIVQTTNATLLIMKLENVST